MVNGENFFISYLQSIKNIYFLLKSMFGLPAGKNILCAPCSSLQLPAKNETLTFFFVMEVKEGFFPSSCSYLTYCH